MQVMLWPEDMADATLLVLSAGDDLVPSALVQAHLKSLKTSCQVRPCAAAPPRLHLSALFAVCALALVPGRPRPAMVELLLG